MTAALHHHVGAGLAAAFLAGGWEASAMAARGRLALGSRRRWIARVAALARERHPEPPRDRPMALAAWVAALPEVNAALRRQPVAVVRWYEAPLAMGPARWPVAHLDTVGDVADMLGHRIGVLRWLADTSSLERLPADEALRHYRSTWVLTASPGARLIEAPKTLLALAQRVVLRDILDAVPSHPAAHGFVRGRSVVSFAAPHAGAAVVVRVDLQGWFPSVRASRVYATFRSCGYPEPVAHLLTGLCTTCTPLDVRRRAPAPTGWADRRRRMLGDLAHPHLPQGAPTSPSLANLAAFGLDRRLAGMAERVGLRYTRYADDLALSSARPRRRAEVERTLDVVRAIVADEGFTVNERKVQVRRSGQHQRLAGVVVNAHPNIDRRSYDLLKATLTNAARYGPADQDRSGHPDFRAHLLGRVAWVAQVNPARGARLRDIYDHIDWGAPDRGALDQGAGDLGLPMRGAPG